MKALGDGTKVSSRVYYYLLDWNDDDNKRYMYKTFNKQRLYCLTKSEFFHLFTHASAQDALTLT